MSGSGFVNHHVHSYFSTLDGLPSPQEIVNRVVEMGQTSISLTDHGTLAGVPSMYRAAQEAGISFTPGCEVYFSPDRKYHHPDRWGNDYYHMILLAYNNEGYQNLVKMQTSAWWEGRYNKPRVDWEILEKHNEGIIATTACLSGIVNRHLLRGDEELARQDLSKMIDIYGKDNLYVEIQNHGIEDQLKILDKQVELAKWGGLKLLASTDAHYCCESDHEHHDSLLCTSTRATKSQENRMRFDSTTNFLHSEKEILRLFPEDQFPGAVSNTIEIAERNEFKMKIDKDKEYLMPTVSTKDGMTEAETLREHVIAGASDPRRYGGHDKGIPDHVMERINYELEVVEGMGFSGYFLIVENIIRLFRENGIIRGAGRGSAPGSVVVYCLGITDMDPFAHELFFERFLNPDRISMPDIDIDIPKSKRQEALLLMEQEYGKGHVAHLSNYNTLAMRDSLIRAAKVFELPASQANKVSKVLAPYLEGNKVTLSQLVSGEHRLPPSVSSELPQTSNMDKIISTAAAFEGTMSTYGVHACGIIITRDPVDDHFPLRRSDDAILPICQFDGNDVEALGGIKMDILGLKNLDECENAERNISIDLGEEVDSSDIPLDDPEVYDLLSSGESGGIFQLGCLAGNTVIDGELIRDLYERRSSTSFPTDIRSVFMGEGVVKMNVIRKVVHTGVKMISTVWTSNGEKIDATRDHKIFTRDRGWVAVEELIINEDEVLSVDTSTGYNDILGTVRAREDIIELFGENIGGITRVLDREPIDVGDQVALYPTFTINDNDKGYVFIHPDHAHYTAQNIVDTAKRNGITVLALSYSQVIEMFYDAGNGRKMMTPMGTSWVKVTDVILDRYKDDTYDIMMTSPVNNYVANGIMVHNSGGMKKLLRRMKPTDFKDISALLALYRPGPMGMDTHNEYSDRKNGLKEIEVVHDELLNILPDTYGLIVFQENIMSLSRELADYTGAEADDLRKATAKKIPAMMKPHEEKFIPVVNEKYGNKLGNTLWNYILPFSEYGFCKAHAVAYGKTTYRTAWLKKHYPAQFAAAVIDESMSSRDDILDTIAWSKKLGVTVLPPSITRSELRSVTTENEVILPLTIVKGMGDKLSEEIISERNNGDFTSVSDFMSRTKVSKNMVIKLAKAGLFDDIDADRAAVVENIDQIQSIANTLRSTSLITTGLFADFADDSSTEELVDLSTPPSSIMDGERLYTVDNDLYAKWERDSLGFILGDHPFGTIRAMKSARKLLLDYPPIDFYQEEEENVTYSGIISEINNKVSNRGNDFCSFTLETDRKVVEAIAFKHIPVEVEGSLVRCEGHVENDNEEDESEFIPKAICFRMKKINVEKLKERESEFSHAS